MICGLKAIGLCRFCLECTFSKIFCVGYLLGKFFRIKIHRGQTEQVGLDRQRVQLLCRLSQLHAKFWKGSVLRFWTHIDRSLHHTLINHGREYDLAEAVLLQVR